MRKLSDELAELRTAGLYRQLRDVDSPQGPRVTIAGRELLNFSSNDYLGLANDPILKHAAVAAIERWGVGAGASRLVCGNLAPYRELEEKLARFKNKEAAIVFGSGYAANVGTITALVGEGDVVILDKLDHASIIDGARQSGATIRVYPHRNLKKLEELLKVTAPGRGGDAAPTAPEGTVVGAASPPRPGRILIVTETVFSMDGDLAPLAEIVALKEKYGAWLMIDEAHATGLYATNRRGIAEATGVEDKVDVTLGTLSKALGVAGGYVVGSQVLIEWLRNRARSLIYSTALPPVVCATAAAAVDFVMSAEGHRRRDQLWRNVSEMKNGLSALGVENESRSPIIPLIIGEEGAAMEVAGKLLDAGILVPAIRYPTVPKGKARLRVTVSAGHTKEDIQRLLNVVGAVFNRDRGIVGKEVLGSQLETAPTIVSEKRLLRPAPQSAALRKGRVSVPNECYFLTTCVEGRRPVLARAEAAKIVIDALRWLRDEGRIRLLGFVIMPDHVHVALALQSRQECRSHNSTTDANECGSDIPVATLAEVMKSWKGFTSRQLQLSCGMEGPVWQDGYYDHLLRDRRDFETRLDYMHENPCRGGLVQFPHEFRFSTAHPDYENEIDWNWMEGIPENHGRGRNAAPTC
ncbi:MAG: 8-amino-7-oxononanoate synthase [Verrucomicrobiae bacterium]|nr:8-amino-7-oxononanoate synthase [Verrucomicrobiae bacterium]